MENDIRRKMRAGGGSAQADRDTAVNWHPGRADLSVLCRRAL